MSSSLWCSFQTPNPTVSVGIGHVSFFSVTWMSSGCGENAEPPGLLEQHTRSRSFLADEEGERPRCGVFGEAEAPGAAGHPAAFVPTGGPKARWLRSTIDSSLAAQVGFFSSKCGLSTAWPPGSLWACWKCRISAPPSTPNLSQNPGAGSSGGGPEAREDSSEAWRSVT